jgi:hypothetical protein
MFCCVERDSERTAKVAFKHISILADAVVRRAELAARGHDAVHEFEGGAAMPGGATATPPVTLYGRGGPERNENELVGKRGNAAPPVARGVRQTARTASATIVASPPTIGRDTATAPHELPRSAVVVSLAMVRAQRHAALRSLEHRPDTTCAILEAPAAWRFDKTNSKSSPTF